MAKRKKKAPVVEAKVSHRPRKRMSRGADFPWQVHHVYDMAGGLHGRHVSFTAKRKAQKFIDDHPQLTCPVIVHVDIPPAEY